MQDEFTLEIAVESTGAALAAERGGADRIELCADLRNGGLTPSPKMMRDARESLRLPIHAIIRPRAGDFVYSQDEFAQMKSSITLARDMKMDGVVLGILTPAQTIDVERTSELINFAEPMPVSFHRAFDECKNLTDALEDAIATGAARILTAGGARNVLEGLDAIVALQRAARNRVLIMPGGGIHLGNFAQIRQATKATEFHCGLGTVMDYGTSNLLAFEIAVWGLKGQGKNR